jgi:SAM-dependent methyltransferase
MLQLGSLQSEAVLDDFLTREGYLPHTRPYRPVTGCWCGSSSAPKALKNPVFGDYQLCPECGCLLLRLVLDPPQLAELYGPRYFREHQAAIGLPPLEKRFENDAFDRIPVWLELLTRLVPRGGRILEIGSSHGRLLQELQRRGYRTMGIELDPEVCTLGRKLSGAEIRCQQLEKLPERDFDLIFAGDVLEHLYDPAGFLHSAAERLRPGGRVVCQSVVFEDWRNCPQTMLRPLFHTILFSRQSLKRLCSKRLTLSELQPGPFPECQLIIWQDRKRSRLLKHFSSPL